MSFRVFKAVFILAFFYTPFAFAATRFSLDLTANSQIRDDITERREIPLNNYLSFNLNDPFSKFWLDVDLRYFHEFENALDDFDLYQSVAHYRPSPKIQADLGRQVINRGFFLETVDGLQLTFSPFEKLSISLYSGIPRTVEIGDFNKDDGMTAGIALSLKNLSSVRGGLKAAWRREEMAAVGFGENDQFLLGADFGYQFSGKMSPFAYSLAEYDPFGNVFETITAGFDLYPSRRFAFNLGFDYFNINRNDQLTAISDLLTRGETFSGRVSSTLTLWVGRIDFTQTYAYQNLEAAEGSRESGHLFEAGFPLTWAKIGLKVTPAYYFMDSFGGRLHGVRVDFYEQISKWYAQAGVDYATYLKITGNDDDAVSTFLWSGYELAKGFVFSGGVEYNANNLYEKDIRGSVKLDYHLGGAFK